MENNLKVIKPAEIQDNVFKLIGSDWMLITAGTLEKYNMMTASWGGFGILWGKEVCFCVVRPHRYTFNFMEQSDVFTLTFFDRQYRNILNLCGTKSGREIDKTAVEGLTPVKGEFGGVYFNEARLVLECGKMYTHDLDPAHFIDPAIQDNYPDKDYHRMYVAEIKKCMIKG